MNWAVLGSLSGILGLIGVLVGAGLTATLQARAARRARDAADHGAARAAVRELPATSERKTMIATPNTLAVAKSGGSSPIMS